MSRIVLVHGAWHGAWCWEPVLQHLEGSDVVAVDLPTMQRDDATFADDVAAVHDAIDGPTLLCGHSYGGFVIGAAAGHDDVVGCVFLCAFAQDGDGRIEGVAPPLQRAMRIEGSVSAIDPALANEAFYGDVHPDLAAAAITKLRPMSLAASTTGVGAWRAKPSTYVVCTEDQSIEVEAQRAMAAACDTVEEWECSHSPMLCRPDDVATLLRRLAG